MVLHSQWTTAGLVYASTTECQHMAATAQQVFDSCNVQITAEYSTEFSTVEIVVDGPTMTEWLTEIKTEARGRLRESHPLISSDMTLAQANLTSIKALRDLPILKPTYCETLHTVNHNYYVPLCFHCIINYLSIVLYSYIYIALLT